MCILCGVHGRKTSISRVYIMKWNSFMDYIFSIVCDLTNCVWGVPQIIECDLLCEQVSKIISLEISNITVF